MSPRILASTSRVIVQFVRYLNFSKLRYKSVRRKRKHLKDPDLAPLGVNMDQNITLRLSGLSGGNLYMYSVVA